MARAYSTLGDVIEQLRKNNETNVDINQVIAGLENMFGKFFSFLLLFLFDIICFRHF